MTTPYEFNVATDADGNDVPVLRSMGSPGSDLGPDEIDVEDVPDGWVVWVEDGQVFMEPDESGSPCSWPVEEDF
jgi:hypothetical protein